MSDPHLHSLLELLHSVSTRAAAAEAAIERVRQVLDTSQTDIALELEKAVRRALDGAQ